MDRKPKNLVLLEDYCEEKYPEITVEECYKLVENYNNNPHQQLF